jgi:hypothetical protein
VAPTAANVHAVLSFFTNPEKKPMVAAAGVA